MNSEKPPQADFHVHYTDETANSILIEAQKNNIGIVAFIGRAEFSDDINKHIERAKKMGLVLLPGVELGLIYKGKKVDLIALDFDPSNDEIRNMYQHSNRIDNNRLMVSEQKKRFEELGFVVGPSESNSELFIKLLNGEITEKSISFCKVIVANPENLSYIERIIKEYPQEWDQISKENGSYLDDSGLKAKFLWSLFCYPGKPAYIKPRGNLESFIEQIHGGRGVVLYSPEGDYDQEIMDSLLTIGVDGVMAWHGSKMELKPNIIKELIKQGKLVLGGSDYDPQKNDWKMGVGVGDMHIGPNTYRKFMEYKSRKYDKKNLS